MDAELREVLERFRNITEKLERKMSKESKSLYKVTCCICHNPNLEARKLEFMAGENTHFAVCEMCLASIKKMVKEFVFIANRGAYYSENNPWSY